jgi:hypothetical protein
MSAFSITVTYSGLELATLSTSAVNSIAQARAEKPEAGFPGAGFS